MNGLFRLFLFPASKLYGKVMDLRNSCFDSGRTPVRRFPLPVISVGNLAVGGTGKTPMCGYLLRLLLDAGRQPALLSRGYGRKTTGYLKASPQSTALQVGDEPLELFRMFSGTVPVSVCEDRCEGARRLLAESPAVNAQVLDDAYQHRHIHRDVNILLTDYSRLYTTDRVLPAGSLREPPKGAAPADIIIVTKCPDDLTTAQADAIAADISPAPSQRLFFTALQYARLLNPAQPDPSTEPTALPSDRLRVLLLAGIARPEPLISYCRKQGHEVSPLIFRDHHAYTSADIRCIALAARDADIVVTTAKDYQRLSACQLPQDLAAKLRVQTMRPLFLFNQGPDFDQLIINAINRI